MKKLLRVGVLGLPMAAAIVFGNAQSTPTSHAADLPTVGELGAIGFDMEVDPAREKIYVSAPALNKILFLDVDTLAIEDFVLLGGKTPMGIDMGLDGNTLYAALNSAGAVAAIDVETKSVTEIEVATATQNSLIYDVVEGRPNRLYVSASPYSSGFAWLAQVKLDQGNLAEQIAAGGIIRAMPILGTSPDMNYLYVGEQFSPESLYKFDISTDTPVKVLEDDHGSVYGTERFDVSPDGLRIYLLSGQVLRTGSFTQPGQVAWGVPRVSPGGELLFVGNTERLIVYDREQLVPVNQFRTPCNADRIEFVPGGSGLFVLGGDLVCRVNFAVGAVTDPVGDTFGSDPLQLDLSSIEAVVGSPLTITGQFSTPIAPASAGAANSVFGFIDLDTDQNSWTGFPEDGMGLDFWVDLSSETEGLVDVYKFNQQGPATINGQASIAFGSTSFTVTIPSSLIGNDDGFVDYDVIVGTEDEATDIAPNDPPALSHANDADGDALPDGIDPDDDNDATLDESDLCPSTVSGQAVDDVGCSDAQVDPDADGVCAQDAPSGGPSGCSGSDNCPDVANADQSDIDGDSAGDACDGPGSGNVDCSPPPTGVSSVDALKVLRSNAGLSVTQHEPCLDIGIARALKRPDDRLMGDVDCSGGVNAVDALKILRAVADLSVAMPVGCPEVKPP